LGFFLILALLGSSNTAFGSGNQDNVPSAVHYSLSLDGTTATILLDRENAEAVRELVNQLTQNGNLGNVKAMVYLPQGQVPILILTGKQGEVKEKLDFIRHLLPDGKQKHLVVISAALRELTEEDALSIGLNLSPDLLGLTTTGTTAAMAVATGDGKPDYSALLQLNLDQPLSNFVQLNEVMNRGKVLVSSDVYTPNGTKAQISNLQQVPIFSTDNNGNVMTQYQQLETSITVIPTTLNYREDKPEESEIRIDATVKASIITSEHTFKATTAPEYTTKNYTTTRVLKANNQTYLVGSYVTDQNYKTNVGLPILSQIPLLKYLFSMEENRKQRTAAILTLAVRLVPLKNAILDPSAQPLERLKESTDQEED